MTIKFQSTPFARRETTAPIIQNTGGFVSIHSLRKKGDPPPENLYLHNDPFQSTPFARRETAICGPGIGPRRVSIHSLRKKGDICPKCGEKIWLCFNPLPSQEGRPGHCLCRGADASFQSTPFARRETSLFYQQYRGLLFQSTPFARRETPVLIYWNGSFLVSIHSLRKKGDPMRFIFPLQLKSFNPLPSQEGRHMAKIDDKRYSLFQSTPFARRETVIANSVLNVSWCFNPLPSQEGRQSFPLTAMTSRMFQSTPFARRETHL